MELEIDVYSILERLDRPRKNLEVSLPDLKFPPIYHSVNKKEDVQLFNSFAKLRSKLCAILQCDVD
jgi:hypothetical protein